MILGTIFNHNFPLCFLYTTLVFFIPVIGSYRQFFRNTNRGIGMKWTAFFAFLSGLICVQCGDFFYYALILQRNVGMTHLEEFYRWLWKITRNYLEWRALVWGASTLLFFLMVNRLPVNKKFACFMFIIAQLFYWGNMRNMLGFTALFMGTSLVLYPLQGVKRVYGFVLGLALVFSCYFLHRSMIMYASAMVVAAIIPWNALILRISYAAFPFLYTAVYFAAQFFLLNFGDDDLQKAGSAYIKAGNLGGTFLQTVNTFIVYGAYAYIVIISFHYSFKNRMPIFFQTMLKYSYIMLYVGFLFFGQTISESFGHRLLNAGGLGATVVAMYTLYRMPRTRSIKLALLALLYFGLYNWLYLIYTWRNYATKMLQIDL